MTDIPKNTELHQSCISAVMPRLFFVVTASHEIEGNWEQLSNGLKTYEDAVRYRDEPFTKKRHPYAYIVASLNEV
jgi:hypothetical protein